MDEVCLVKGFEGAQVDAVGVCMTPLEGLKGSMFKKKTYTHDSMHTAICKINNQQDVNCSSLLENDWATSIKI